MPLLAPAVQKVATYLVACYFNRILMEFYSADVDTGNIRHGYLGWTCINLRRSFLKNNVLTDINGLRIWANNCMHSFLRYVITPTMSANCMGSPYEGDRFVSQLWKSSSISTRVPLPWLQYIKDFSRPSDRVLWSDIIFVQSSSLVFPRSANFLNCP